MKNTFKRFGIIAFVAVIGLSMAACGDGGGDGDPDPDPFEGTWYSTDGDIKITGANGTWTGFFISESFPPEWKKGQEGTYTYSGTTVTSTITKLNPKMIKGRGSAVPDELLAYADALQKIPDEKLPSDGKMPMVVTSGSMSSPLGKTFIKDSGGGGVIAHQFIAQSGDFYYATLAGGAAVSIIAFKGIVDSQGDYISGYLTIPSELGGKPVTGIGGEAFENAHLSSVTIPEGIIIIGNSVFDGNLLVSVTIPASVTSLGNHSFANNNSLTTVICLAVTPPILVNEVFKNSTPISFHIEVPEGRVNAYKNAEGWKDYSSVIFSNL